MVVHNRSLRRTQTLRGGVQGLGLSALGPIPTKFRRKKDLSAKSASSADDSFLLGSGHSYKGFLCGLRALRGELWSSREGSTAEHAEDAEMTVDSNKITEIIIGSAIDVHRELGPGLLESTYEACLAYELVERGLRVDRQKSLPVQYRGVSLDCGYRIDLLVEDLVIVELKAVERLEPIHEAQLLSYLKLSGVPIGLLLNFNVTVLRRGIRRLVNNLKESSPLRPPRVPR